jgi:hypothetical protein
MKYIIVVLLILFSVHSHAQEIISKSFELRYFTTDSKADGETYFRGKTTSLNTDQRVEFLKKYADYGKVFFKDPHLDTEIVTDKEAAALLKTIKEQPLPQVRHRIPLKQWKWLGYRPGQRGPTRIKAGSVTVITARRSTICGQTALTPK